MCERKFLSMKYAHSYSYAKFGTFFCATQYKSFYSCFLLIRRFQPIVGTQPLFRFSFGNLHLTSVISFRCSLSDFLSLSCFCCCFPKLSASLSLMQRHFFINRVRMSEFRQRNQRNLIIVQENWETDSVFGLLLVVRLFELSQSILQPIRLSVRLC